MQMDTSVALLNANYNSPKMVSNNQSDALLSV